MAEHPDYEDGSMSDDEGEPELLIASDGIWINLENDATQRLLPPVVRKLNFNVQSPPATPSCAQPNEDSNADSNIQRTIKKEEILAQITPEGCNEPNGPERKVENSLDDVGKRIFQELHEECEETRKRTMRKPKWVQECHLQASDIFMEAEKWRVVRVHGKRGFFAPFPLQSGSIDPSDKEHQEK